MRTGRGNGTRIRAGTCLFHVPAANFYRLLSCSEFTCAVRGGYLALLAREQRNVVIFPDYRKNLLIIDAFVDLQADEECQTLAGIFYSDVGNGFSTCVFGAVINFELYFGKLCESGVVGEGVGWGHPPGGLCPVNGFGLGREPVEVGA